MDSASDVQRSLGRIEGALEQCLGELRSLRVDFSQHKDDDATNFSKCRSLIFEQRDLMHAQIQGLVNANERAKGAGWVILSLLGALASFAGAAVIAALGGYIKIHFR